MQACKHPADAKTRKQNHPIAGFASTHDGGDMHVGGLAMLRPRTAREVDSYSTRLAHLATKQEREEHNLRTSSTRRKTRWGLGGYGGLEGAGEVGFEKCGPYRGFLPRASVRKDEGRDGEASCGLDGLQPWRLQSSAVAAATMANGGRWSCGFG